MAILKEIFLFSHLKKIKIKLKVASMDYKPILQFLQNAKANKQGDHEHNGRRCSGGTCHCHRVCARQQQTQSGTVRVPIPAPAHFTLPSPYSRVTVHWALQWGMSNYYLRHTWLTTQYMIIRDPKRWFWITKEQGNGRKYSKTGRLAMAGSPVQSNHLYEISKSSKTKLKNQKDEIIWCLRSSCPGDQS